MTEYRVNVFDNENVVGRVRYNSNLDFWNGYEYCNGSAGRHEGLTKLRDGRYVLISGTQWQGEKDTAKIITKEFALKKILQCGNLDLLNTKKFRELKEIYKMQYADIEELEEQI